MSPPGCLVIVGTKLASLGIIRMGKHKELMASPVYRQGIHRHCCGIWLKLQYV